MNPIFQFIQILIILLVGTSNGPVHDLRKKPTKEDHLRTLNCIFQRYQYIFLAIFFLIILITFVWVCFSFVGASAVESGTVYNHMGDFV